MRVRVSGLLGALSLVLLTAPGQTASACHACRKTPCVLAPPPAYQCVTEMVPYTVMKTRMRIDFQAVTETINVREAETTWTERQRVVCKPVFDTTYISRKVLVCKPVFETTMVNQTVTVCKPVTSTHQVTEICMQPFTQLVNVPVRQGNCGRCGKVQATCGCQTVAQTCYKPVPVVRDVVQTTFVRETETRQVPLTKCSIVREEKVENIPITKCRLVQEVVTEKIPCTTFKCVSKQVTRQIPIPVCETVPVTCYRPVTRMVACAPIVAPTAQGGPSPQTAASGQQ